MKNFFSFSLLSVCILACSGPKIHKADSFDSVTPANGEAPFFGKIIPEVKFGKKPGCWVQFGKKTYELPEDGMVFLWGPQGETTLDSVACFRDHNWLPKVVFHDKTPLFQNVGKGKITYFGTLKVKVRDPDESAFDAQGPLKTVYQVTDNLEEATQLLRDNFPLFNDYQVQKKLAAPTQLK